MLIQQQVLLFLAIGLPIIISKKVPTTISWVGKVHDPFTVVPGGAISTTISQSESTTPSSPSSLSLERTTLGTKTHDQAEHIKQTILIKKRNGTFEPLNKDKVGISCFCCLYHPH